MGNQPVAKTLENQAGIEEATVGTDRNDLAINALEEALASRTLSLEQLHRLNALNERYEPQFKVKGPLDLDALRFQRRVHGIEAIRGLGFDESRAEPEVPDELIKQVENAVVKSMLILDDGRSMEEYAQASANNGEWLMKIDPRSRKQPDQFVTETHDRLEWKVVPMDFIDPAITRKKPKHPSLERAREAFPDHEIDFPEARLVAKAILLHHSATGEKLFEERYAFTSTTGVLVGAADREGFTGAEVYMFSEDAPGDILQHEVDIAPVSRLREPKS